MSRSQCNDHSEELQLQEAKTVDQLLCPPWLWHAMIRQITMSIIAAFVFIQISVLDRGCNKFPTKSVTNIVHRVWSTSILMRLWMAKYCLANIIHSSDIIHQMRWVQHSVMNWRHTNQSMIGQLRSCFWQQIQSFNSLLLVITTFLIFQPAWLLINWLWWMVFQFTACFFIDCGCARKTWGKLLEEEFWWKLKAGPDLLINPWESNRAKKKEYCAHLPLIIGQRAGQ